MIAKLAWRNVWRNKVRSLIVILASTLGITGALFIAGMISGMANRWVQKQIDTELSDIQIHKQDYVIEEDLKFFFDRSEIDHEIKNLGNTVNAISYRIRTEGLAMSAHNTYQVIIRGIEPHLESQVSDIGDYIKEGSFLDGETRMKQLMISQKLAKELKVRLNSKVVMNLSDIEGHIIGEAFKVTGIFKTGNGPFDQSHVYVRESSLRELLQLEENQYHELAIRLNEETELQVASQSIISSVGPDFLVETWQEMNPGLQMTQSYMATFNWILLSVVLIALIFGIINTMLMVVLERTREIGMLRSLGLNNRKVATMFILETVYLTITGAVIGNLLSFFLISHFGEIGIHFQSWAEGFESYGMEAVIFPVLESSFYLQVTFLVLFTGLLASYFPVNKAIKLEISTAIRN